MLSRYRVLDLTDEGAMICGQILGDLGADVILGEPPHGAQARRTGPFVNNQPELNRSLNYWSLNRNKRSVTIDLESRLLARRYIHQQTIPNNIAVGLQLGA